MEQLGWPCKQMELKELQEQPCKKKEQQEPQCKKKEQQEPPCKKEPSLVLRTELG